MKNLRLLTILFVASLMNVSCLVDDTDEVLETAATRPYVVGFKTPTANLSYFADEGAIPASYKVDLIGGFDGTPAATDLVLNYQVNAAASTAVEGMEYDFPSGERSVTIPAGSDFAMLDLLINTGGFNLETPTTLVIDLISVTNDAGVVAAQNKSLTINFIGCQADLDQYQYNVVVTREDNGQVLNRGTEIIYFESINNFRTQTTATLGPNGQPLDMLGLDFTVLCGTIVIPSQGLFQEGFAGNEVVGIAETSVDENGNFTLRYTVNYGGATGYLNFTGVYTRL